MPLRNPDGPTSASGAWLSPAGAWLSPAPPAAKPVAPAPTPPPSGAESNAERFYANVNAENQALGGTSVSQTMADLQQFGFSAADAKSLSDWYLTEQQSLKSPDQIQMDLYKRPEFAKAFPGIVAQIQAGVPPMAPSDYVTFKKNVNSMAQMVGLPPGFITDDTIGKMVASNMNLNDLSNRISAAQTAVQSADPNVLNQLSSLYHINLNKSSVQGALTGYFLDPNHPLYGPEGAANTFNAANIGASAARLGYGTQDPNELMKAAQMGATAPNALSGLESKATLLPLENPTLEGNPLATAGTGATEASALGLASGLQQRQLTAASQTREASGSGGGGFSPSARGTAVGSGSQQGAKGDVMQ